MGTNYTDEWLDDMLANGPAFPPQRALAFALARLADSAGNVEVMCTRLATMLATNEKTARRHLEALHRADWIHLDKSTRPWGALLTKPDTESGQVTDPSVQPDTESGLGTESPGQPRVRAELLSKDSTPPPKGGVAECGMRASGVSETKTQVKSPPNGPTSTPKPTYSEVMAEPDFEQFVDQLSAIHEINLAPAQVGAVALRVLDELGDGDGRKYLSERFAELQGEVPRRQLVSWAMADSNDWLKRREAKTKAITDGAGPPKMAHQASKAPLLNDPEFRKRWGLDP